MARIFQIELTNDCNYTCTYCPRTRHMTRPIVTMSKGTILQVINIMDQQLAIRIHHYGESLLEKDLCYWAIERLKASGKVKYVILNTNGSLLTRTILTNLFDAGLDHLNVSYHTQQSIIPLLDPDVVPEHLIPKINVLHVTRPEQVESIRKLMMPLYKKGYQVELKRMRNLGGVLVGIDKTAGTGKDCAFLTNQEWVVFSDGSIGTCCHTFDHGEGVIGNVWDNNVQALQSKAYSACVGCPGYSNDSGSKDEESIPLFEGQLRPMGSVVRAESGS